MIDDFLGHAIISSGRRTKILTVPDYIELLPPEQSTKIRIACQEVLKTNEVNI